jgi:hypothetical protein
MKMLAMADLTKLPVDSEKGIAYLMDWARTHGAVLNKYHHDIANKHGVPTDGAIFAGKL